MPLSEDEQRILRQIEEQLQQDSGFGRTIRRERHGSRRVLLLAAVGVLACLAATIGTLSVHPLVSFVAFVGAVLTALVAERQLRLIGEAGLASLSESVRTRMGNGNRPGPRRR